jgi:hypothetical protein
MDCSFGLKLYGGEQTIAQEHEVGVRATLEPNLALTFVLFNLWQQSETIIDPDVGADSAGPPSRRYWFEVNVTYKIRRGRRGGPGFWAADG